VQCSARYRVAWDTVPHGIESDTAQRVSFPTLQSGEIRGVPCSAAQLSQRPSVHPFVRRSLAGYDGSAQAAGFGPADAGQQSAGRAGLSPRSSRASAAPRTARRSSRAARPLRTGNPALHRHAAPHASQLEVAATAERQQLPSETDPRSSSPVGQGTSGTVGTRRGCKNGRTR
jgi:hypothetical protein